jgi:hypothetical protein
MKHASKYVHVNRRAENVVSVNEEQLESLSAAPLGDMMAEPAVAPQAAAPAAGAGGGGFFNSLFGAFAPSPSPAPIAPRKLGKKKVANPAVINREVDTHVVGLSLGTLTEKADQVMETGDPFFCSNERCAAALSKISKVENVNENLLWTCEFCGMLNSVDLDEEEVPKKSEEEAKLGEVADEKGFTVEYILEPAAVDEDAKGPESSGIVVFCIDVSGSMCVTQEVQGDFNLKGNKKFEDEFGGLLQAGDQGYNAGKGKKRTTWVSRLQAVQAAVDAQLEALAKKDPKKQVVLVTFSNEVNIVGNGISESVVVAGSKIHSEAKLKEMGEAYVVEQDIAETKDKLSAKLFELETGGQTALGPALLVSLGIAGKKAGSKIILCTDGLANIGPGSVEILKDKTVDQAASLGNLEKWYSDFGNSALEKGVSVDVISITADDCYLELLGKICDISRGTVDRVDPMNLKDNFKNILEKPVIATNVVATMLLHSGFRFRNVDAAVPLAEAKDQDVVLHGRTIAKKVNQIGNVFSDTEVFFEYSLASDDALEKFKEMKALPFQVQIRYTRLDGSKWMRLITQARPITTDAQKAVEDLDVSVLASNAAQKGAELAQQGNYEEFRAHNYAWKDFIVSNSKHAHQAEVASNYSAMVADLDQEIVNLQESEAADGVAYSSMNVQEDRRQARALKRNDKVATKLYQAKAKKF